MTDLKAKPYRLGDTDYERMWRLYQYGAARPAGARQMMDTTVSFTFQARRYVPPELEQINSSFTNCTGPWVMSAGRWDNHLDAVKAAGAWLTHMAEGDVQQYELQIIQVEEIDLLEGSVNRG